MDHIIKNFREGNGTPLSTLAWKIPWMEEPGRLQSMGSLRVKLDWATSLSLFTFMHWRRKWQPTPLFLPGESQGQGSLVGCRLWGRTESDWSDLVAAAAAAVSFIHLACQSNSSLSAKESDQLHCFLRALPFPSMNKGSWEGFGFFNIKKYLTHAYTDIKNRCVCMCVCIYIYIHIHTYERVHTHIHIFSFVNSVWE